MMLWRNRMNAYFCRTAYVGLWHRTDHPPPLLRCPLIGVDRKWSARRQTGAFDPKQS
jgi:hypothetical protein